MERRIPHVSLRHSVQAVSFGNSMFDIIKEKTEETALQEKINLERYAAGHASIWLWLGERRRDLG